MVSRPQQHFLFLEGDEGTHTGHLQIMCSFHFGTRKCDTINFQGFVFILTYFFSRILFYMFHLRILLAFFFFALEKRNAVESAKISSDPETLDLCVCLTSFADLALGATFSPRQGGEACDCVVWVVGGIEELLQRKSERREKLRLGRSEKKKKKKKVAGHR